jgi:pullulanase/glycogen debranching enzyme
VLQQVKLIAEPWDLGAGGYQVGNFPLHWAEWNGRYRDAIRAFRKGEDRGVAEVATRIAGSNDLYEHSGRREMTDDAWNASSVRSLGVLIVGDALDEVDERGRPVRGDTLLITLNAHDEEGPFALPGIGPHTAWVRFVDTIAAYTEERCYRGRATYALQRRSPGLFVLRAEPRERPNSAEPRR